MTGYTKLFSSIVASTIWREDDKTRIVWITMLALSDSDGFVEGSIPGLADLARVTVEECEQSLAKLQQPDKYSRTPDHDGRRIEVIDGGWFIVNRAKYRDKDWQEDKLERRRQTNRRYYERHRNSGNADPKISESDNSDNSGLNLSESDRVRDKKEKEKEKDLNPSSELNNSSDQQSVETPKNELKPSKEAERLSQLLKAEILRNKPDYRVTPAQLRKWAVSADRMIRIDRRQPEQIATLIRWVQHDEFWMANVLSMDTLREKFDQLELKRSANGRSHSHPTSSPPRSAAEQDKELMAEWTKEQEQIAAKNAKGVQ